jgi:uncharacterized spore protein YtfJ
MTTKELIDSAVAHLKASASVKTVYGEPIVVDGKTIIPVAKVAYGFGGGMGPQTKEKGEAAGQGAGGGLSAKPVGMVEIAGNETKFVPIAPKRTVAMTALFASGIGLGLGLILGRASRN